MIEYTIKILGAQYAANPDYKFGDPETPEMWARTIGLLSDLRDMRPRVVLKLEPTNPNDPLAVMARAMGNKIGYVCKGQRDRIRTIISQSKRGMLAADICEVVVAKHGYLYITLKCPEIVDDSTKEPGFDCGAMGSGTFAPRFKQSVTVVTIKYKTPCFFPTFFLVVCRKFCNFAGR